MQQILVVSFSVNPCFFLGNTKQLLAYCIEVELPQNQSYELL